MLRASEKIHNSLRSDRWIFSDNANFRKLRVTRPPVDIKNIQTLPGAASWRERSGLRVGNSEAGPRVDDSGQSCELETVEQGCELVRVDRVARLRTAGRDCGAGQ